MKSFFLACLFFISSSVGMAQTKDDYSGPSNDKYYKVVKQNGSVLVGKLKKQDAREVLLETKALGEVYIPRHEIREMQELKAEEMSAGGEYLAPVEFSSRYFFTTNGLPIKKGEGYVKWSLLGPDVQFAVADNVGVGIITTWSAIPIIATLKYSIPLEKNVNMGLGVLVGSGSWLAPDFFAGLPFAALTLGDSRNNINFSLGYGGYTLGSNRNFISQNRVSGGEFLCSVAAMLRLSNKVSFVFDSFVLPIQKFGFVTPGLRFDLGVRTAFQLGFTGLYVDGTALPLPIPNFMLFQKF